MRKLFEFTPGDNRPPSSGFATPDLRNQHDVLDFDGATDEEAIFKGSLDPNYAGGGITVRLHIAFTSATSGTSRWQAAFEAVGTLASDSFAAFQSSGLGASGTAGDRFTVDITLTDGAQIDSLAAEGGFRLKIRRDADGTSGTDDIATDAELWLVEGFETGT